MYKLLIVALWLAAICASNAFGATGNLVIYDDADENGFNHAAASCGDFNFYGETDVVHSGTKAIAAAKTDNNGAGWAPPTTFSTVADYDSISFWVNAGDMQTTQTSLAIYDAETNPHYLHLEDVYGAPLPVNTWIPFHILFSSPFFSSPPATVQMFCLLNHSSGGQTEYFYLDDVALTGADIFKNGFDN